MFTWLGLHWATISILGGLIYTGLSLWAGVRVRRAEVAMDINKQHRELWIYYEENPEIHGLKAIGRDMVASPLTAAEARFAGFLFDHLSVAVRFRAAGIYAQPECLRDDIRGFLSYPAVRAAWEKAKRYHDRRFVAFVTKSLRE